RPAALSTSQVDYLLRRLDILIKAANTEYHVTVDMLRKDTKTKASARVILNALHKYRFAKKYKGKSSAWWNNNVHAFLDGKHFKTYLTGTARRLERGLCEAEEKPLAFNTGSKSALVMGAVGKGKMLLWHIVPSSRWTGQAAAEMYSGPLKAALEKAWPGKKRHLILEDNDPTGFQSKKGKDAKSSGHIGTLAIPKRSPDLNPMDFAIWSEINKRLRRQERNWSKAKRESRAQYLTRLRRTALRLSEAFVKKAVGDLRRRCQRLYEAKGNFFQEGGV
ncbi:unnamed protein product, partial [Effrenium voratum]